jgi:hypothetical protein
MRSNLAATAIAILGLTACQIPQAFGRDDRTAGSDFAQATRPPARIRVRPLGVAHPGPNAVRQCFAWIEPEHRPSGTVIVPRMHCWWEGG